MALIDVPGGFQLEADAALRPGAPAAIVCHPHPAFGGRMDTPLVIALADALADAGLSTVRFNFRGLGGSGGEPTGGLREHEDVRAVAAWMRAQGAPKLALVGYSFGSLMAMRAIADGERAEAYAAVGFPTTILGDHADRIADVRRAIATGIPWLFASGDDDPFCELDRVRDFAAGQPTVTLDVRPGGHFFHGAAAAELSARVARFVKEVL
jgi:alpha/beta superfamily hydrolase